MSQKRIATAVVFVALFAAPVMAQQNTTIQLPTFNFTTVTTTVSVPDRGGVSLGGISRSRSGTSSRGTPLIGKLPFVGRPFGNRSTGRELGTSNLSVHAYIHDFEAMDEAILARAAARHPRPGLVMNVNNSGTLVGENLTIPNAVMRQRQESAQQQAQIDELADLWSRAQEAEKDGKRGVAKIFYRMISRDATGDLKQHALARLDAIGSPDAARLAASAPR